MATKTTQYHVYRNYIHPLSNVKDDFKIAEGSPDVRGWDILGSDGVKFGKVHELIVDLNARKVRYLDIDMKKGVLSDEDKEEYQVLIPIGAAILNPDDKNVIVPNLDMEQMHRYPLYRREPIYVHRDYERSVQDFFSEKEYEDRRYDPAFYDEDYYNDHNFYKS